MLKNQMSGPDIAVRTTVRTSSWSSDDNKRVELFRIQMLSTTLLLVLALQYLTNPIIKINVLLLFFVDDLRNIWTNRWI